MDHCRPKPKSAGCIFHEAGVPGGRRSAAAGRCPVSRMQLYPRQTCVPRDGPTECLSQQVNAIGAAFTDLNVFGLDDRRHLITVFAEPGAVDPIEVLRWKLEAGEARDCREMDQDCLSVSAAATRKDHIQRLDFQPEIDSQNAAAL
jgi:hypothetical protein